MDVRRLKSRVTLGLCLLLLSLHGCQRVPQAPELHDSPVYQNDQEGFRFLVPEGWTQTASTMLPPGNLDGENFLVRYRVSSPEEGSLLQVLCFQEEEPTNLAEHHAEPSFGVQQWRTVEPPQAVDINGTPGEQFRLRGQSGGRDMTKDVVSFRKGDRVYSFVGLYFATDEKAQQQIRRAIDSVIWE